MSKKLSLPFTHEIFFKEGDKVVMLKVTEKEGLRALKAWKEKDPVPIPNKKDPKRSDRTIAGRRIEEITRFTYIN